MDELRSLLNDTQLILKMVEQDGPVDLRPVAKAHWLAFDVLKDDYLLAIVADPVPPASFVLALNAVEGMRTALQRQAYRSVLDQSVIVYDALPGGPITLPRWDIQTGLGRRPSEI